jgi:hypothetical protein
MQCTHLSTLHLPAASSDDLEAVLHKDLSVFSPQEAIPGALVQDFSQHHIVILGEDHYIQEHHELLVHLVKALYPAGFRQVILELPHAESWMYEDYVLGKLDAIEGRFVYLTQMVLEELRRFNQTLPDDAKIHVYTVDCNHGAETFTDSLRRLPPNLARWEVIQGLLKVPISSKSDYERAVKHFARLLADHRRDYAALWGEQWTDRLSEMAEIELQSLPLRNAFSYMAQREKLMQSLVERRIQHTPHKTILNIGSYHAQKTRYMGSPITWIAEYLSQHSPSAAGKTYSVCVAPLAGIHITAPREPDPHPFDLLTRSAENEIFRTMAAHADRKAAYLPLRNPLFANYRLPINHGGEGLFGKPIQFSIPLSRQFDALIILPEGLPLKSIMQAAQQGE